MQEGEQRAILYDKVAVLHDVFLDLGDFRNDRHTNVCVVGEEGLVIVHEPEIAEDTLPASDVLIAKASGFKHPMSHLGDHVGARVGFYRRLQSLWRLLWLLRSFRGRIVVNVGHEWASFNKNRNGFKFVEMHTHFVIPSPLERKRL
jgi:hypothetical protein